MYSGTDIASHSTGQQSRVSGQGSDPDADWGYHETHGVDARTGKQGLEDRAIAGSAAGCT